MPPLIARPLSSDAYSFYGHVIAAPDGASGASANQGSAARFDHLAPMENVRGAAAPLNVSVFRCAPRPLPFEVALLEKHTFSTQIFVPMSASRYLVVVALGEDGPDLDTVAVFEATGRQGVSYHPGVWHHPMIALDQTSEFVCLVHEDGSELDCVVRELGVSERFVISPMSVG